MVYGNEVADQGPVLGSNIEIENDLRDVDGQTGTENNAEAIHYFCYI
jgi:hypothetical protein